LVAHAKQIFVDEVLRFVAGIDDVEQHFERCYRFAQKLASQDVGALPDLDDYLKCSSQLEYIAQLRRSLENEARTSPLTGRLAHHAPTLLPWALT
jgi:hypothetical protein